MERLDAYVKPYVPEGVKPCPVNLQFTLEELNKLTKYESNLNDYIRTNLIRWLLNGGVSDSEWASFQDELKGKLNIESIRQVYQDAYDRYIKNDGRKLK